MKVDRALPRQPVNLSLNPDLVRQAREHTGNLSATIDALLQEFVQRERARRRDQDAAIDDIIDRLDAFHHREGLLSDEFQAL